MELDPAQLRRIVARGRDVLLGGPAAWRNVNVMSLLLNDEQRAVMADMQALMCVVEGHGTFVMNRIGAREIPSYERMKAAVESRRGSARGPEKAFQRAIGLDMKYEQYVIGEKFCDAVADRAGIDAVNKVWEREENLPSMDEMRAPDDWLVRVGA
jgi:putative hydrolase